jgi:hypothetical protein
MPQGPRPPDYAIPATEIGVVVYQERQAVGLQFVDPSGAQIFVSIPGSLLPLLAQEMSDLAVKMPAILSWDAVKR